MEHLITRSGIESNKAFQRLLDKTQVLTPQIGRKEIVKNRLTHSYEVATSAEIIAHSVSTDLYNADYNKSVYNVALLHDIGHPPFGHKGARLLNQYAKTFGVEEGFSDNNNNLIAIAKNQIKVSDYELASLIKYPEKLYPSQAGYAELLNRMIDHDLEYFKGKIQIDERPKRTLACQIMDEADENTYTCADLVDCFSLGIADESRFVEMLHSDKFSDVRIISFLSIAIQAIQTQNKTLLKKAFEELKIRFNQNYYLGPNLKLCPRNAELAEFKKILFKLDFELYVQSDYVQNIRKEEMTWLEFYIQYVIEEEFYPSKFYRKKIQTAKTEQEKYTYIRDMIASTTDNFVKNFFFAQNN